MKAIHSLVIVSILTSCKTTESPKIASSQVNSSMPPALDYSSASDSGLNEEYIPAGEQSFFAKSAREFARIHQQQQQQNEGNGAPNNLRGMHAKGHGCVRAQFVATPPETRYKVGIFADSTPREVVVRFSNGSGLVSSDAARDLRGMALKIFIPNLQQLDEAKEPGVQDILATNAPVHHAANIVELMQFTTAMAAGGVQKATFLASHPSLAARLLSQTQRRVGSVLNESYWSRAPFGFGNNQAVKYVIKPLRQLTSYDRPDIDDTSWLAQDLAYQVSNNERITFGVYAQFQTDPVTEPLEDHSVEWTTGQVKLAEFTIHKQNVDSSAKCENLIFNPWNAGKDHRPLGNMNRGRRAIYEAAEAYRAERQAQ